LDSAYPRVVRLSLLVFMAALCADTAKAQNTLTNGGNHDGSILQFQTNTWTFTANASEHIVLRSAQLSGGGVNFYPWMRIYDPNGVLIADSGGANFSVVSELALTMTNSGAFTVLVSDSSNGG